MKVARLLSGVSLARVGVAFAAAWCVMAGLVLGRYSDEAIPAYYVLRPLLVAGLIAVPIATLATVTPAPPLTSVLLAVAISITELASAVVLIALIWTAVAWALRMRGQVSKRSQALSAWALVIAIAFLAAGTVRAASVTSFGSSMSHEAPPTNLPTILLVLLDGYPRADSLRSLGIDNEPFLDQLRDRGFDIHSDAHSPRRYTELTLMALLNGGVDDLPADAGAVEEQRAVRGELRDARLPRIAMAAGYEFAVIDSPIGHVTFDGGRHIQHGALNNFEESLLTDSMLGSVVQALLPAWPMDSLRDHLDASLGDLVTFAGGDSRLVLAHLLAPHLPFLWDAEGPTVLPDYWPRVQLFESVNDIIGLTMDEYVAGYRSNLEAVNERLLGALDQMIATNADSPIVLFSDHGARYSFADAGEWDRTFLAARTPGNRAMFADTPSPDQLICPLLQTYASIECEGR